MQVAIDEQDWLAAHMCLDLLATFLSASPAAAMQALACPLLETLANVLHRFVAEMQPAASGGSVPGRTSPAGSTNTLVRADTYAAQVDEPLHFSLAGTVRTAAEPVPAHAARSHPAPAGALPPQVQRKAPQASPWHDGALLLKVVRMISTLAGSAPAHCDALRDLGVVGGLVGVLERFSGDRSSEASTSAGAYETQLRSSYLGATRAFFGNSCDPESELLIESLWCLSRLVDASAEGQKAALAADGAAVVSRCARAHIGRQGGVLSTLGPSLARASAGS